MPRNLDVPPNAELTRPKPDFRAEATQTLLASAENQRSLWPPQDTAVDFEGSAPGSEERGQGDPNPRLPTTKGLPRKEDF